MKISVIIPVYNAAKFVKKAVKSALEQPETGEIILIEDGSPDNALEICRQLENENNKIKLLQHPNGENRGAAASRNLGIKNAKFNLIAFLDADDYYLPNRFKKDIEILSSNKEVDGIYSATQIVINRNNTFSNNRLITLKEKVAPGELFEKMAPISGEYGFFIINALTIRKSIFAKTGLFNTQLELSQDTELFLRMSLITNLAPGEIDKPVAIAIEHGANRVTNTNKIAFFRPFIFKYLLKWGRKEKIPTKRKQIIWKRYFFYFTLSPKYVKANKINQMILRTFFLLISFKYPFLWKFKDFYNKFPLLNRFF